MSLGDLWVWGVICGGGGGEGISSSSENAFPQDSASFFWNLHCVCVFLCLRVFKGLRFKTVRFNAVCSLTLCVCVCVFPHVDVKKKCVGFFLFYVSFALVSLFTFKLPTC